MGRNQPTPGPYIGTRKTLQFLSPRPTEKSIRIMSPKRETTSMAKSEPKNESEHVFTFVTPMDNLPGGYVGIATVSETQVRPDDPEAERDRIISKTSVHHWRRLEDIRLGVAKGRHELRQEAEAILQAASEDETAPAKPRTMVAGAIDTNA